MTEWNDTLERDERNRGRHWHPAVVGCGDATIRLETGDRVRVDGSAGTVILL
jgi:hypothetical protein